MDAKDSETANKASTIGKEQPCASGYSVNTRSIPVGVGVGFIFEGCFIIMRITTRFAEKNSL